MHGGFFILNINILLTYISILPFYRKYLFKTRKNRIINIRKLILTEGEKFMEKSKTIKKLCAVVVLFTLMLSSFVFPIQKAQAKTISSNNVENHGGYGYGHWRGLRAMVLKDSVTIPITKHFGEWRKVGMEAGVSQFNVKITSDLKGFTNIEMEYGDLNGDGFVDSHDYTLLKRHLLAIPASISNLDAADLNGDGYIDSNDATLLSRYILKIIDIFPVENIKPLPTTPTPPPSQSGSSETTIPTNNINVPSFSQLINNQKLPDPFTFIDGSKVTSLNDWSLRRAEISALAQKYVYGEKPSAPESVTGSARSNKITITVKEKGKTISFDCAIQYPSSGQAPYPAMIGMGMNTLNTSVVRDMGVALITFPIEEIAQQSGINTRGRGKFYDIYGNNHSAGALMAWAWGVSRLIDALETTPDANIDPTKIAVTGGSRNGKGALAAGAFDERIALTIPQESGSGGTSSWRVAEAQKSSGQNVQTLSHIITEQPWLSKSIEQFVNQTNKLPVDQHMILAICAPRGLLVVENTGMEWLGNVSCYTASQVARMVYESLGIKEHMGFSQVGGHMHCAFPDSQIPELRAFIQKFLLGDSSAKTDINKTDGNFSFDRAKWVDWSVPILK